MFITENKGTELWTKMLKENFNVNNEEKLAWVSQYAANHEIYEAALSGAAVATQAATVPTGLQPSTVLPGANGVSPLYATPLNTVGMGNPAAPGPLPVNTTAPGNFFAQTPGSGDIPVSTLPMALNVALLTIGLELVPVIPAKGPWALLTYMDFPYAGGKLGKRNEVVGLDGIGEGRENKPLYFKVVLPGDVIAALRTEIAESDFVTFTTTDAEGHKRAAKGVFKSFGRMDGGVIIEVAESVIEDDPKTNISLAEVFAFAKVNGVKVGVAKFENGKYGDVETIDLGEVAEATKFAKVDFAQTMVDFIDGFANFATGKKEAMTRAQNETGTGNVIGLRLFSKWIQMGSYEVTGTVTRQQLQDLPLYGVDAISKVLEAMQNELTQHINTVILDNIFALGVTNAVNQKAFQGLDLNLHMGKADKDMAATTIAHYTDVYGVDHKATWGAIKNVEVNTSAENLHTRQRRVATRILAAANTIMVTGRRGKGNICVTNLQIATALQDVSGYVVAPMANTMSQTSGSLYFAGQLGGVNIYVDPYMTWDDTRVCVGRKGNGNEPGLVFMPYILADQVSIVAEGTMSQKLLTNSRFCITPVGFYPDTQYYTFVVDSDFGLV